MPRPMVSPALRWASNQRAHLPLRVHCKGLRFIVSSLVCSTPDRVKNARCEKHARGITGFQALTAVSGQQRRQTQ